MKFSPSHILLYFVVLGKQIEIFGPSPTNPTNADAPNPDDGKRGHVRTFPACCVITYF